jgi:hypothetical protein
MVLAAKAGGGPALHPAVEAFFADAFDRIAQGKDAKAGLVWRAGSA